MFLVNEVQPSKSDVKTIQQLKDTSKDVPQAKVEESKSNRQRRQSVKQQKSSALPEAPNLDDIPAETKCTEYSEVESVVSIPSPSRHRQLEVTSSVVKRLRQRSGMY